MGDCLCFVTFQTTGSHYHHPGQSQREHPQAKLSMLLKQILNILLQALTGGNRTTIPNTTQTLIFYPPPLHTPPIPYQQNHRWYLKPPDTLIIINVCLCSANLCSFFLSKSLRAALFASSSCALCWHHCVYSLWVCFLWVHRWQLVSISNAHFSLDVWFTAPQFCTLVLAKKSNFCPLIRLFIYTCVRLLIEFEPT